MCDASTPAATGSVRRHGERGLVAPCPAPFASELAARMLAPAAAIRRSNWQLDPAAGQGGSLTYKTGPSVFSVRALLSGEELHHAFIFPDSVVEPVFCLAPHQLEASRQAL